jgi:hypothetical protein
MADTSSSMDVETSTREPEARIMPPSIAAVDEEERQEELYDFLPLYESESSDYSDTESDDELDNELVPKPKPPLIMAEDDPIVLAIRDEANLPMQAFLRGLAENTRKKVQMRALYDSDKSSGTPSTRAKIIKLLLNQSYKSFMKEIDEIFRPFIIPRFGPN